jgi:hypothetical protein
MKSNLCQGEQDVYLELRRILSELFSKFSDFMTGWRPVRVTRITVEHQGIRFQPRFEFILRKFNSLIVVVRTHNLERQAVFHLKPPPPASGLSTLRLFEQYCHCRW